MGWFSGSKSQASSSDNDPLRDLDPDLRAFLKKESPVKYEPTSTPSPPPPQLSPPIASTRDPQPAPPPPTDPSAPPAAPSQSLYPDGRYAHLWSTYKPLSEIEAATKTDQEKLLDVLEGYKQRKADIGRAALENCVLEQEAWENCIKNGGFMARMSMCRAQNKEFERCFTLQNVCLSCVGTYHGFPRKLMFIQRFLKALGYLSAINRPASVDEEIQMHADALYHRMLDQEKAQKAAKTAGLPIPQFAPIIPHSPTTAPGATPASTGFTQEPEPAAQSRTVMEAVAAAEEKAPQRDYLTPEARAELKKRIKDQPAYVREVEEKAMRAEAESDTSIAKQVDRLFSEKQQKRDERIKQGESTLGDTISRWLGW